MMDIVVWPYIKLSRHLAKKEPKGFGNMFRHQLETFGILLENDYPVLLKAALIHDLFEDGKEVGFENFEDVKFQDQDGEAVFDLVSELSIRNLDGEEEPKSQFLHRIMAQGTNNAKILKLADRISNINSLLATSNNRFITK